MYYVFDVYGIGCADIYNEYSDAHIIDKLLSISDTEHPNIYVGKYNSYEEAKEAAKEYEIETQTEVDKVTGNYDDYDYVGMTQEDYLLDDED